MPCTRQWFLTVLLPFISWLSPGMEASAGPLDITVMTQNLYLGAEPDAILAASTPAELQAAIQAASDSFTANNYPVRAMAIASEAAKAGGPLLIGLQEAEIVSASGTTLDFAQTLVGALALQGLNYTIAGVHQGFHVDSAQFGLPGQLSLTDQEVVLARTDVSGFTITGVTAPTFVHNVSAPSPLLGPIPLNRGYVLVDATLDGTPFEFVSTHLDETHSLNEPAQAGEILAALGAPGEPQLVVGDFNAGPNDLCGGLSCGPADMLTAGFIDAGAGLGLTCCQPPDLNSPTSALRNHYDYIFERDFSSVAGAFLIGDQPFEGMRPFWPSDHAGVLATLTFAAVPEPATASLLLMPVVLLIGFARLGGSARRAG